MAAGGGRSMEESSTWAVALVCLVIISISLGLEQIIHIIGKVRIPLPFVNLLSICHVYFDLILYILQWLTRKNKSALFEALEKIKSGLS